MSEWVLEVSEVNEYVRQLLQNEPALRKVRLRGEISNFKRHSSGHWYFTLKDERCRIAAVMFRQNAMRMSIRPMDGMSVIVSGQVGLYSEGGSYQITCDSMRPDGIGTLYQQFEALKNRLAAEGLFDEEHKRRLPYRPKKIAVVTSETGAVLHDICMVSRARDPGVPLVLVPVQVQGAGAAESIAQGIRRAAKIPEVEVVIVGRGGGSMEDLWAFNDERVARAIFASEIPVVSAVGHEPDVTISDFVADVRAATPSNAAELVAPDQNDLRAYLLTAQKRMAQAMQKQVKLDRKTLDSLRSRRVLQSPINYVNEKRLLLDHSAQRLGAAAQRNLAGQKQRFIHLTAKLDALSPLKVLARGYSVVLTSDGRVVQRAGQVQIGDQVDIKLHQGSFTASVTQIQEERNGEEITDL